MTTKLRGEVISKGSIAYDALSDDVKSKIENSASGADYDEVYSSAVTNTTEQITVFYTATVLNLKYVSSENKVYYRGHNTLVWSELLPWILGVTLGKGISSETVITFTSVNMFIINEDNTPHAINDFKIYAEDTSNKLTWNYNGKKYTWNDPDNIIIEEISDGIYVLPFTFVEIQTAIDNNMMSLPFRDLNNLKQAVEKNKQIYIKHGGTDFIENPLLGLAPCSVVFDMARNAAQFSFLYFTNVYVMECNGYAAKILKYIDFNKLSNTLSDITTEE